MYVKSATDRRDLEGSRRRSRCTVVSCGPYTPHDAPVRTLYTLFCLREIPADSYSLERNKRYLFPSSLSFSPSLFLFLLVSRKRIARAAPGKFLPLGLLLHSALFARGRATGGFSFYASHFLLSANFVFLSCPSLAPPPVHGPPRGSSVALLSFFSPFLVASPRDPVTGDYATHNGEI